MRLSDILSEEALGVPTPTPEEVAKMHGVGIDSILSQLEAGIEVELEHTRSENVAREIALDHLAELPDYYSRLKRMETE